MGTQWITPMPGTRNEPSKALECQASITTLCKSNSHVPLVLLAAEVLPKCPSPAKAPKLVHLANGVASIHLCHARFKNQDSKLLNPTVQK